MGWANTQLNLGVALHTLGTFKGEIESLERAQVAYESALLEFKRDRSRFEWALTYRNLAELSRDIFDLTKDASFLDAGERQAASALDVYLDAGTSHFVNGVNDLLNDIAERRAALKPPEDAGH